MKVHGMIVTSSCVPLLIYASLWLCSPAGDCSYFSNSQDLTQIAHEHAGRDKDQKKACDETVNTRRLSDRAAKQHCTGYIAFALRLASDSFKSLCNSVTFTDTRADTGDQSTSCTDCASCKCNTFSENCIILYNP